MKTDAYLGILPELGGEAYYVVSSSAESAKKNLLMAWREYDRTQHSDYHGRVKTFDDLHEIYGAMVVFMPWDKVLNDAQLEPIL